MWGSVHGRLRYTEIQAELRGPTLQLWLFEGDGADVFALAVRALAAFPEAVEVVLDGVDHLGRFGPDAELEVAFAVGFGAQARAGEVGAAEVHAGVVDDDC